MAIDVINSNQVRCTNENGDIIYCDPLAMFTTNDNCGQCPVLEMCERYMQIKFDMV